MLIAGSQFGIITCTGPIAKDYQKRALVSKYECCCLLIYVFFFRSNSVLFFNLKALKANQIVVDYVPAHKRPY